MEMVEMCEGWKVANKKNSKMQKLQFFKCLNVNWTQMVAKSQNSFDKVRQGVAK